MTDLTEQLQELSGNYWCEITESPCIEQVYFPTCSEDIIVKVLAKVPSYNEWQASEKYNKHLEEVIKVYERKDKQATKTSIAYNELLEENAQLKELLKSALSWFPDSSKLRGGRYAQLQNLKRKISEVLK